jgi:2'-5' RNA ligase
VRLFVAVDLDADSRAAIAALQTRLAERIGRDDSLRWVDPLRLHLTLAFIGETPDDRVPEFVSAFSSPVPGPPFTVVFQHLGIFPERGAPRVLWVGLSAGADTAIALHRHVAKRLEQLKVTLEHRPFHPHLTLARWRSSRPSAAARAAAAGIDQAIARLDVGFVTLYRSRLSPAGPAYTALARATLT